MLTLVGLGLNDENDMTLRGIEAARKADKVYLELYTGKWMGSLERLEKIVDHRELFPVKRGDLEENSRRILEEARDKKIVVLIQGDPMVATTHTSLMVEAKKMGVSVSVVHNSSIFSAIAETGLHVYKFGSTVTLPFPEKTGGKLPKSVYDSIKDNKQRGLHTLCLLDIGPDASTFMTPNQAMELLMDMERVFGENVIEAEQKIVVLCRAGKGSQMFSDGIETLHEHTIESTPAVLIVPGKLHFTEEEFLDSFKE